MPMMIRLKVSMFALVFSTALFADLTTSVFPPPGGVTFSSAGNIGQGNGKTNYYQNFDTSQFQDLYWGPVTVGDIGGGGDMTFSSYSAANGIAIWTGPSFSFFDPANSTPYNLPTRFELQVQPYTGSPQGFTAGGETLTTKGAVGITGAANEPVFHVNGSYQAQMEFQVDSGGGTWVGVYDFYNSHNGGGLVNTSVNNGFWDTDATVPEPASICLFATFCGLTGLQLRRRLRVRSGD
jgi:hypothetical protein